ncbi:MAG: hypothetical protein Q4B29_03025 [Candidatus Saccharibacteria bacterium]|nr:hypothetical protein [Candidatus Saccharibacteria bacterium]
MNGAFTVLPMSQTVSLRTEEVFEGSITVANPADATEDFSYVVSVSPYMVIGEEYAADLLNESDYTEITNWIEILEPEGSLAPNETREIRFKITVPETAPGGGQYAAITVRSAEDNSLDGQSGVQNIFEIASVLFASVDGEVIHEGEILENNVPGFSAENPAKVSMKLSNSGNIHEKAVSMVTVKNVLTGEMVFPRTEEEAKSYIEYIMPGTTRLSVRELSGMADLGIYEVSQTIYYMGESSVVTERMVMCPIWFMILAALTVLAGVFAFFKLARRRKNRKAEL